jgi:hypothetical protein
MTSILKVDTIQDQDGNNIINENANTVTIGKAGDSVNVSSGAIKDGSGNVVISKSGSTVTIGASGDTVSVAAGAEFVGGGIQWQSTIVTGTTLSAVAGNGYWIDTTSNACTVTLPASASVGDIIEFADYARTWAINNVTINTNSLNYQGNTSPNPTLSTEGQHLKIVYSGATNGWIPTNDDPVALGTPQGVLAEYLVVGGGGAGATNDGAGGGAGGYLTNYGGSAILLTSGATYTVTVGAGGSGISAGVPNISNDGSDSVLSGTGISTITSVGGGKGGTKTGTVGGDGGSGGGGTVNSSFGSGTVGQGNDGGPFVSPGPSGGGGGAGEAGNTDGAGAGGDGLSNSITGSAIFYAGGGGGCATGVGGQGGGTNGVTNPLSSSSSPSNTGGGSGGANDASTGNGGSGVVIIRVPTADYPGTTTGSPTVSADGTDTVIKFTGSGSYTA